MRKLIRADGSSMALPNSMKMAELLKLIGADTIDTVTLRHLGYPIQVMLVDDAGYAKGRPVNREATNLYLANCRAGTTHVIRGDVVVVPDDDFAERPLRQLPPDPNAPAWPFPDHAKATTRTQAHGGGE
jgi:hypothetical protein